MTKIRSRGPSAPRSRGCRVVDVAARHAAAPGELSRRAQSRAARGGRDARWPAARARRRRHRQDPGADDAHCPYFELGPGAAGTDSRRHLHQQSRARDENPHRPIDRRRGRRHAVARHLPRHRRQDPAPACRAGRSEAVFHRARYRRSDQAVEATARRREYRREALAGAAAGRDDRRLEEPGAHAEARAGRARASPSPTARRASSTRSISGG